MSAYELSEVAEEEERRRRRAPWGVIALVLLTGLALIRNGSGEFDIGPPQPASAAAADGRTAGAFGRTPAALPYAVPDRVRIPAIRVDAPVTSVGLDADGWVGAPPPEDPNLVEAGSPVASRPVKRGPRSSSAMSTTNWAPPSSTVSGP